MLSYQHIFHAANHADILKHFTLMCVLENLNKKEKPYTFFDTHSASGLYDLLDNRSQKTNEAQNGVLSLLNNEHESNFYFDFISPFVKNNTYPGSPLIELLNMREQDTLILSELHPAEIENLKKNISNYKTNDTCSVQVHKRDGWEMLNALTPPKTKRGAVLIDPSYEENDDYKNASKTILSVFKKWNNGIFMLWYPLLAHKEEQINNMLNEICDGVKNINQNVEIAKLELLVDKKDSHKEVSLEQYLKSGEKNPPRLYGSGMLVVNSPWQLEEKVNEFIKSVESELKR